MDEANALVIEYEHELGPCERLFRSEGWVLDVAGEPVAVAISSTTVSAHVCGYGRQGGRRARAAVLADALGEPRHASALARGRRAALSVLDSARSCRVFEEQPPRRQPLPLRRLGADPRGRGIKRGRHVVSEAQGWGRVARQETTMALEVRMSDRYMTAQEFEDALADDGQVRPDVNARDRGTRVEEIRSVRLLLSNGRRIVIAPTVDIDGEAWLTIDEEPGGKTSDGIPVDPDEPSDGRDLRGGVLP
jgi:hypothetical protein